MLKGHKGFSGPQTTFTDSHPLKGDTWNHIAFSFMIFGQGN